LSTCLPEWEYLQATVLGIWFTIHKKTTLFTELGTGLGICKNRIDIYAQSNPGYINS